MTVAIARALLSLAACCLGERRHDWALAMRGELEAAIEGGRPLAFALGCLLAAWREMPGHREGRFVLANNALALGLLVPMGALQLVSAAGLPSPLSPGTGFYGGPVPGSAQDLYLREAFLGGVPSLIGLTLLLSLLQLRLAWLILERDWMRVARIVSLVAAATAALLIITGVLFLDGAPALLQVGTLVVDILAGSAAFWWHRRIFPAYGPAKRG